MSKEIVKSSSFREIFTDVVNNAWQVSLQRCREVASSQPNYIRRIITNKSERPASLDDQCHLLSGIYELEDLQPSLRVFAAVAATHKALESLSDENIRKTTNRLEELLSDKSLIQQIEFTNDIRTDQRHTYFSLSSVLWHAYLFDANFDKIDNLIEQSQNYYESLNEESTGDGFYQTCGNVYRLFAYRCLISVCRRANEAVVAEKLDYARRILLLGISKADGSDIKFDEFAGYASSFKLLKNIVVRKECGLKLLVSFLPTITRNAGREKSDIIRQNFSAYLVGLGY